MENYENKELLKDAAKKSLESLKDLKPGTEEYDKAANMALKLYDMQLKDEAQENEKNLKEDEAVRKVHEMELDQENSEKARRLDWAKIFGNPHIFKRLDRLCRDIKLGFNNTFIYYRFLNQCL